MARVRVPAGTIQKLETVFDNLQTYIEDNQKKRLALILKETFGFALRVKNGVVQDNDFKVTLSVSLDTPTALLINAGHLLTQNNKYVKLTEPYLLSSIPNVGPNQWWLIRIRYAEQGTNLQTAMSSFLYDPTSGETSKYTRFNDSYVVEAAAIFEGSGWRAGIGANNAGTTLALAIVKSNSDAQVQLMQSEFTFSDVTDGLLTSDSAGVIDLRSKQRMTLDKDLLDDTELLMKDRNSTLTDGGALVGNLDVVGNVMISGILTNPGNFSGITTTLGFITNNPDIFEGTNAPMATMQKIGIGMPWNSGDLDNDSINYLSIHRTTQDSYFLNDNSAGYTNRGVLLKLMGSAREFMGDGNITTEASTIYFKDSRLNSGKYQNTLKPLNFPTIYALNKPNNHKPTSDGSNWRALGLNTQSDTTGVIISKTGGLVVGGAFHEGETGTDAYFSLYGYDERDPENYLNVANIASIYSRKSIAISSAGAEATTKGIYWVNEAGTNNYTRPFTSAAITLLKEGSVAHTANAGLKIELRDGNVLTDARTKLRLTSAGMLMLGNHDYLDGNSPDAPDIVYWGSTKEVKLLVDGNAKFHNSRVSITDEAPRSHGDDIEDPTFEVKGITSLSGDVTVTGVTKFMGGIDIPAEIIVSGITVKGNAYINHPNRPNISFQMRAPDDGGSMLLTHALGIDSNTNHSFFSLHDPLGNVFASMHSSGISIAHEGASLTMGAHNPNTGAYSTNHLAVKGEVPAVYLQAGTRIGGSSSSLNGIAEGAVDWFIGTRNAYPDVLALGSVTGDLGGAGINAGIRINSTGKVTVGNGTTNEFASDSDRFNIFDKTDFYDEVTTDVDLITKGRVFWKVHTGETSNPSAGIDNEGRLFVKTTQQPTGELGAIPCATFGGAVHIWNDNNNVLTRPQISFGTNPNHNSSRLMLDTNENLKVVNQSDRVLWESSPSNPENIILHDIECGAISGTSVRLTESLQTANVNAGTGTFTSHVSIGSLTTHDTTTFERAIGCSGVNASEFYIGVGTLGANAGGLRVLTENIVPTQPVNLRVKDNNPMYLWNYPWSVLTVNKNYNMVQGTGVAIIVGQTEVDFFQVDTNLSPIDEPEDNLKGKWFTLDTNGGTTTFKIAGWDNTLKRLDLKPIADNLAVGINTSTYTGQQATAPNYGTIRDVGDNAVLEAIPVDSNGNLRQDMLIHTEVAQSNEISFSIPLGNYVQVRSKNTTDTSSSSWAVMPSGSYDPDHLVGSGQSIHEYGYPFYNVLPFLEDDGAIATTSSPFGFTLDITGWGTGSDEHKTADEFDIGYSTGTVNFEEKGQVIGNNTVFFTSQNRHIEVNVINQATYNIAVRPLQNGQVVGQVKTAIVTAGGGGAPADYVGYFFGDININHHTGTFVDAGAGTIGGKDNGFVTWSGVALETSPFSDTAPGIELSHNQLAAVGGGKGSKIEVLSSNGNISYGLSSIISHESYKNEGSGDTMDLSSIVGTLTPGFDTTGNKFIIDGSKPGRRIGQFSVTNDITIKVAVIDIEWATGLSSGNPGVIRVYQEGQEAQAGTMNIGIVEGGLSQVMEVEILGSSGTRKVIIDAWDPDDASPNNTCSIHGTIELYGQAITGGGPQITL